MTDDLDEAVEFGPAWTYVDRVHFPEQLKLSVSTLLTTDRHYRLASAAWRIERPIGDRLLLKAFGQIIPLHTRMLKQGPSGSYDWNKEMMVNLGIIQLYLETLRRPFNELMVILTAERRDSTVVQIISRGVVLEVLRPPLDPSPRWWYQQIAHNVAMADHRSLSYR
jgi:hypothetical protein